ncbi:MAG TPA: hypothetical protein VGI10_28485 [Polyangiaceae bacterium]
MSLPSGVTRAAAGTIGLVASVIAFSCVNGQPAADEQGLDPSGGTSSYAGAQSAGGSTQTSGGALSAGGAGTVGGAAGLGSSGAGGGAAGTGVAGTGVAGASGSGTAGSGTAGQGSGGVATAGTTGGGGTGTAGTSSGGGSSGAGAGGKGGAGGAGAGGKGGAGAGGMSGAAGSAGASTCTNPPPPVQGGTNGWASRYWDCCKPACGWKANVKTGNAMASCSQQNQSLGPTDAANACPSGGSAFMCWSDVPWSVCDKLSYGFAAVGGNNYTCGRCYQLQFDGGGHSGTNPGATSLNGKTMIVQVINNGGVDATQFDLLIPGGGVGALNACGTQWGSSVDLGSQYGGLFAECNDDKTCTQQKCQAAFGDKPDLLAGCNWFLGWFNGADNPTFTYKQVACPSALTQKSGLSDPG